MSKDKFSLNFWPSFSDLMLSLVLIVLSILGVFAFKTGMGEADLKKAQQSQESIYNQMELKVGQSKIAVVKSWDELKRNSDKDIIIFPELNKQHISFSDKILFEQGKYNLLPRGRDVLNILGPVIANNLDNIIEIRIEGHTDTDDTAAYNLQLGAQRAIEVYNHLTLSDNDNPNNTADPGWKIDPAKHLISISSYGKFKPAGRNPDSTFNRYKLMEANRQDLKAGNRRIEIVLEYKHRK